MKKIYRNETVIGSEWVTHWKLHVPFWQCNSCSYKKINHLSYLFSSFSINVRNTSKMQIPGHYLFNCDSLCLEGHTGIHVFY